MAVNKEPNLPDATIIKIIHPQQPPLANFRVLQKFAHVQNHKRDPLPALHDKHVPVLVRHVLREVEDSRYCCLYFHWDCTVLVFADGDCCWGEDC